MWWALAYEDINAPKVTAILRQSGAATLVVGDAGVHVILVELMVAVSGGQHVGRGAPIMVNVISP